jgi:hypothetical protein
MRFGNRKFKLIDGPYQSTTHVISTPEAPNLITIVRWGSSNDCSGFARDGTTDAQGKHAGSAR